ncbi:MAG: diguanylate cyclase [Candidatus Bipolaricaulis sp.]|nr:diguanylate cyclase [Candidatus Bipolaricaulis sp.]
MSTAGYPERPDAGEDVSRPDWAGGAQAAEDERSLQQLRESETRYRRLFETAQDGILLLDASTGQIADVNPFMVDMLGYPREHFLGRRLWEIGPVKDEEASRKAFLELQEKRYVRYEDLPLETFEGRRVQVEFVSNVYAVGDSEVIQCNIRNVSARKLAETALRETSRKIAELHRAAHQLETCEREEDVYLMAVDAAERVLGFLECSLYIKVGDRLVVKAASSEAIANVGLEIPLEGRGGGLAAETIDTDAASRFGSAAQAPESCLRDPALQSGISVPLNHLGVIQIRSPVRDAFTEEDARLLGLLAGYTAEAMRRIRLQRELREQATRDPLTGVYNRRYFTEVIAQEVSRSRRHGRPIGFLMVDVNRFKQINDQLGHVAGDRVLKEVGALLQSAVRGEDFVIRYGGDEFLIVLPETDGETSVVEARIRNTLDRWNAANPTLLPFRLDLAIGEAHWLPQSEEAIEEALAEADRRMYEQKRGAR